MNTLVNICAPERSGTTMLDLMLGSGPDAFSLGEISGWFRLYRYRDSHTLPNEWESELGLSQKSIERLFYGPPADFHAHAFEVLGVSHLIDSSKEKTWIIDTQRFASAHGYSVINLLLIKDPVEFAHSFWKRGRYDEWERVYRRYYEWILSSDFEFASILLDDLVKEPASVLQEICDYIDLPYFPGKERFWEFLHLNVNGSPGVRKQVKDGDSSIEVRSLSPEFLPLINDVRSQVEAGPIHDLVREAKQHSIQQASRSRKANPVSHRYDPSLGTRLRHQLHGVAKKGWLRLRHNSALTDYFYYFNS